MSRTILLSKTTIVRRKNLEAMVGLSRSTIYVHVASGLLTKPVALGARAVGWPISEIEALTAARIAGKSEVEIRQLVARLHAERRAEVPPSHTGVRTDHHDALCAAGAVA